MTLFLGGGLICPSTNPTNPNPAHPITHRHDDVGFRIHATRQLPRISRALGAERTREELIPFVVDSTDDEDEVLLTLAEAVGTSLGFVCLVLCRWRGCS